MSAHNEPVERASEPTLIADYVARLRIFLMPMCDSPAASAMARSDAPSALIWRIASSRRTVASRAFRLQEATSLAVTSSAGPGACPVLPGRTPGRPRRPGRPAEPGPSPSLLCHVGDVPGGVLSRKALEGQAVSVAAGATDLEARKGSGLAGRNGGDGGEVSGHDGLLLPLGGGSGGVCGGHEQSKPCLQAPVNKVSTKDSGAGNMPGDMPCPGSMAVGSKRRDGYIRCPKCKRLLQPLSPRNVVPTHSDGDGCVP